MKLNFTIFATIILLLISTVSFAQTIGTYKSFVKDNVATREHPVDMIKTVIKVSFDLSQSAVIGNVTHTFVTLQKTVDSLFLDAPDITINSCKMDNQNLEFKTNSKGVIIYFNKSLVWDKEYVLDINYMAKPKRGLYFIGWNDQSPTLDNRNEWGYVREQIWTQGQGTDNRYWIPCYDEGNDKTITETIITFDKNYKVLSNGVLASKKDNKNGTLTWHYKMSKPHATYLIMLGIGEFDIKQSTSKSGVPVNFWYYPQWSNRVPYTSCYTEQMVDFMESELQSKYPWESYSQVMVQDFLYGAMENTSATIFGDFFFVDAKSFNDRNYVNVNMHEFTHQWFGDYVTARNYAHQWLQESYATHYPKYFERSIYGEEHFQWLRKKEMNAALEASKSNNLAITHTGGGTSRVYQKGSLVLDMLRYVLGNDEYRKMTSYYLKKHGYNNVETYDLQVAIHETLGKNLDWFFDEWVWRGGEPHYEISYQDIINEKSGRCTQINIKQLQQASEVISYFKMPVNFIIYFQDGSSDKFTEWVEGKDITINRLNKEGKKIACVVFDANNQILKQVTFNRTYEELKYQIENAENMIDQYEALLALKDISLDLKKNFLIKIAQSDKFHAIRSEAWNQIFSDPNNQNYELISIALKDKSIDVRKSVVSNINNIPVPCKSLFINLINDSSYVLQESLLEKLYLVNPNDLNSWIHLSVDTGLGNNILIKRLELKYRNGDANALNKIIQYSSEHYEFRTRINAFNSLKTINYCNQEVAKYLMSAVLSWNGRLAGPAKETIDYFIQQKSYKAEFSKCFNNFSIDQRKLLKDKGLSF